MDRDNFWMCAWMIMLATLCYGVHAILTYFNNPIDIGFGLVIFCLLHGTLGVILLYIMKKYDRLAEITNNTNTERNNESE